jgi:hypothetical protein
MDQTNPKITITSENAAALLLPSIIVILAIEHNPPTCHGKVEKGQSLREEKQFLAKAMSEKSNKFSQ